MGIVLDAVLEIVGKSTVLSTVSGLMLLFTPLTVAVFVGLFIGWAWRPRWAASIASGYGEIPRLPFSSPDKTDISVLGLGLPTFNSLKVQLPNCITTLIYDQSAFSPTLELPPRYHLVQGFY